MMAAASMAMLLASAALAVDLGSVYLYSRKLQGAADLAAIAAASNLPRATAAAEATARANGFTGDLTTNATPGHWANDPAVAPAARFTAGAVDPDAARVTLTAQAPLYFGEAVLGRSSVPVTRTATAARADLASFSIGSRLASLNGGIANALISALLGGQVNLTVMDYNGLANANVDLLAYVKALRTRANLGLGSFDSALDADVALPTALAALGDVLSAGGNTAAAQSINKIAAAADVGRRVKLSALLDLGPYAHQSHVAGINSAKVNVSAMDLAGAVLSLGQEGRQVKLDLGASVPGVADVDVWLAIGERPANSPWIAITDKNNIVVRTAQTRLYLEANVGGSGALAALGIAQVKLPLLVEVASAEAKLSSLSCANGSVSLAVAPSVGKLAIAEINTAKLNDFKTALTQKAATLVSIPLIKVTGQANVDLGGAQWKTVSFSRSEIDAGAIKSVSTSNIVSKTVSTLLGDLELDLQVAGLGLGLGGLTQQVAALLAPVGAPLDGVVNLLLDLVGVKLGEADVQVNGLRCGQAALVA
ncbi:MAG: hypothetical protein J0I28_12335 [Caulobacterales bacterium]|nr:hypothetical protein [Caulobacterales bacterium]